MGIASFILGIISFVLSFVPFLGFMMMLPAMVGFVLGIVGLVVKKETKKGFSITGIVLSSLAFFVMFISTIFFIPLIDNWVEDSENLSNLEIEVTDDTVDIEVTNDDSESIYEPSSVTTYVVSGKMSFDVPDELELFEEGLDVTTFYLNDNSFVIAEYASYEDVITYDDLYDYWEELYDVSVTTSINIIGGNPWRTFTSEVFEIGTEGYFYKIYYLVSSDGMEAYAFTTIVDVREGYDDTEEMNAIINYVLGTVEISQ